MALTRLLLLLLGLMCRAKTQEIPQDNYFWNTYLRPENIITVPYGLERINVWRHSDHTVKQFFAAPEVNMIKDSAHSRHNPFSGLYYMHFNIQMWSREFQESIFNYIREHLDETIDYESIDMLPMEKVRLYWNGAPWPGVRLDDSWRINTKLRSVLRFQFICDTAQLCATLEETMKTNPEDFWFLELQYSVSDDHSSRRRISVNGQHMAQSRMWIQLENLPGTPGGDRYLTSADVERLSSDVVNNVVASEETDVEYIPWDDQISLKDILLRQLNSDQVLSDEFSDQMWQSTFWREEWSRPDKIASTLNKIFTNDENNSWNFAYNGEEASVAASASLETSGLLRKLVGVRGSAEFSVQKEDLLNKLEQLITEVQWNGDEFIVKSMVLSRINLSDLKQESTIAASNVQIKRVDVVKSIPVTVDVSAAHNDVLSPNLIRNRLQEMENKQGKVLFLDFPDFL